MFESIQNKNVSLEIGERVKIGSNVVIGPNCRKVKIGYGTIIGRDIYIDVEDLDIGEYTTIHHGCVLHGKRLTIGHNCWFGHYTIIDALGGDTRIGNNVGVGAHSQLWSHIKCGDVLQGCRWNSSNRLYLDDDVWLVGHCIVGPIHAKTKSMLLAGSVATKDLEENRIYAGSPAVDVSPKLGLQFSEISLEEKIRRFFALREDFCAHYNYARDCFCEVSETRISRDAVIFDVSKREYFPTRSELEYKFIRYMLYDKAKWIPHVDTV
jgi:acetyltransferase-like isoleucine patch superfamily enzyme